MPESIAVSVKNVSKQFDNVEVLRDINLTVEKGTVVSILGSSGSGKSTLLRCMNWLEQPDRGEIHIGGQRLGIDEQRGRAMSHRQLAKIRERVGMVFQSFNLIDELTVFENVELPLLYAGVSMKERVERVNAALDRMQIAHRSEHFPQQLSGGQQQRVAIARAIVTNPHIVLADEPTGNLDSVNGNEVMNLLTELNREGTTVVMVTHSEENARMAGRLIRMIDGNILTESRK